MLHDLLFAESRASSKGRRAAAGPCNRGSAAWSTWKTAACCRAPRPRWPSPFCRRARSSYGQSETITAVVGPATTDTTDTAVAERDRSRSPTMDMHDQRGDVRDPRFDRPHVHGGRDDRVACGRHE